MTMYRVPSGDQTTRPSGARVIVAWQGGAADGGLAAWSLTGMNMTLNRRTKNIVLVEGNRILSVVIRANGLNDCLKIFLTVQRSDRTSGNPRLVTHLTCQWRFTKRKRGLSFCSRGLTMNRMSKQWWLTTVLQRSSIKFINSRTDVHYVRASLANYRPVRRSQCLRRPAGDVNSLERAGCKERNRQQCGDQKKESARTKNPQRQVA